MSLQKYQQKRDFTKTPEPNSVKALLGKPPGKKRIANSQKLIFVIQEHHARNLHWDFRLEHKGALASWALPKGLPAKINEKRLAVQVEDHPFEYKDFEGEIPEGQYGAGHVEIWDKGNYAPIKWDDKVVEVVLNGKKADGRYSLIKTSFGKNSWLLIKQGPKDML